MPGVDNKPPMQPGSSPIGSPTPAQVPTQRATSSTSSANPVITTQHMVSNVTSGGPPHASVSSAQFPQNSQAAESHEKTTKNIFSRIWDSLFGSKDNKPKAEGKKINWRFWTWGSKKTKVDGVSKPIDERERAENAQKNIEKLSAEEKHSIIKNCIGFLNKNNNVGSVGIFRLSGDTTKTIDLMEKAATIKLIKDSENSEKMTSTFTIDDNTSEFSVGLLMKKATRGLFVVKQYDEGSKTFVDGPDKPKYDALLKIASDKNDSVSDKIKRMQAELEKLPDENKVLLKDLFVFLNRVHAQAETNKMSASNLAITFAPNLFPLDLGVSDQQDAAKLATEPLPIIEFLIRNANEIFPEAAQAQPSSGSLSQTFGTSPVEIESYVPTGSTPSSPSSQDVEDPYKNNPFLKSQPAILKEQTDAAQVAFGGEGEDIFKEVPLNSEKRAAVAPDQSGSEKASPIVDEKQLRRRDRHRRIEARQKPFIPPKSEKTESSGLRVHLPEEIDGGVKIHFPKTPIPPPPKKKDDGQ